MVTRMKLHFRWKVSWWPTKPGRKGWTLTCNGVVVGGVVRYRWRQDCIGYITVPTGDRDVARSRTPGPAKQRVKAVARALLGGQHPRS